MLAVEEQANDAMVAEPGARRRFDGPQLAATGNDAKESLAAADPNAPVSCLGKGVDIGT